LWFSSCGHCALCICSNLDFIITTKFTTSGCIYLWFESGQPILGFLFLNEDLCFHFEIYKHFVGIRVLFIPLLHEYCSILHSIITSILFYLVSNLVVSDYMVLVCFVLRNINHIQIWVVNAFFLFPSFLFLWIVVLMLKFSLMINLP